MNLLTILDILLGLSVVMLIMSLVVTAVLGSLMGLLNQKGRNLREGLVNLLVQLNPSLSRVNARQLGQALLKHPLIADANNRMGHVIQRHEFAELLLLLGSGKWKPDGNQGVDLALEARKLLSDTVQGLDPASAATLLGNVRASAINMLQSNPDLPEAQRRDRALLAEAKSTFTQNLFSLFDATIERAVTRFSFSARIYSILAAALVASATQFDTLYLINRLSMDESVRKQFVDLAIKTSQDPAVLEAVKKAKSAINEAAPSSTTSELPASQPPTPAASPEFDTKPLAQLRTLGIFPPFAWTFERILGILISIALLTFGAPFWYDALKNLIKLRSVLSRRDDQEREQRLSPAYSQSNAKAAPVKSISEGSNRTIKGTKNEEIVG